MSEPRQHWLANVARRAHLPGADDLLIAPTMPVMEAWARVGSVCRLDDEVLAQHVASHFHLAVARLDRGETRALKLVPERVARKFGVLPLREDNRYLVVATSNPVDLEAEQALGFASSRSPVFEVSGPTAIRTMIDQLYSPEGAVEALLASVDAGLAHAVRVVEPTGPEAVGASEMESVPVVKLTNMILSDAVSRGVSDIHIEPGKGGAVVRLRVDGVLANYMQMPLAAMTRVVSRIKIIGKLDITDRLRPQDGRARIQVHGKTYDLRISTVPTRDSEKAVLRILDPERSPKLDELGMFPHEMLRLRELIGFREGIVIVTGPTGSGKTTTMYSCIHELATGRVNIMTVEDPVEYEMSGITQIQVDPKRSVTFPSALRAMLRQDPDVMFVGEIRDLETAQVAVQASMTGHLVLATIHTNDAVSVVQRMVDLGLDRSSIAGALRGVVAQRLVRRVCAHCAVKAEEPLTDIEKRLAERFGVPPMMRAVGCKKCGNSGYRGRFAVNEVVLNTGAFQDLILTTSSPAELHKVALAGGMRPMRGVAVEHAQLGHTTLEEVERVMGESSGSTPIAATPAPDAPHILLCDDDAVVRLLARGLLEKNGFRVSETSDGPAALEHLDAQADIAMMVLNLGLTTMHGIDVLRAVRKTVATVGLPVLVLTGSDSEADEVNAMEAGADDYIQKPIDPPRFVARVKAALRRAGG